MRIIKVAGAAVYLLALMAPAMAASHVEYGMHRHFDGPAAHRMSAMDFDHFDYGIRSPTYHSGWSGPYGDGDYPGSIDRNMGPPYWSY